MDDKQHDRLKNSEILSLWMPLLMTWLLIATEAPYCNIVISHLANSELNLAAFNITYSFFLLAEAPILMLNMLTIKFGGNQSNLLKVKKFILCFTLFIFTLMLLFLYTSLYKFFAENYLKLDINTIELSQNSLKILLPTYIAIGFRRFFHGVLVSHNQSKKVLVSLLFRICATISLSCLLIYFFTIDSIYTVSIALMLSLILETVVSWSLTKNTLLSINQIKEGASFTYNAMIRFYHPLMLASTISLMVSPLVTFFLGRSAHHLESLAIYSVIQSVIFLFRATAMSLQEVFVVNLIKNKEYFKSLKYFSIYVGMSMLMILLLIASEPLYNFIFGKIISLDSKLAQLANIPFKLLIAYPLLTLAVIWQRSLLIARHSTSLITLSSIAEVVVLGASLYFFIDIQGGSGIIGGVAALLVGRVVTFVILYSGQFFHAGHEIEPAY